MKREVKEEGSTLLEFIIVIPCYLILCLLTVEVCLMWADRHIVRLAAFEAARIYAGSSSLDDATVSKQRAAIDQHNLYNLNNPCMAEQTSRKAAAAAIQKTAIIAPSITYLTSSLGLSKTRTSNFQSSLSLTSSPIKKLVNGWPAASLLTKVECRYDQKSKEVTAKVTYFRHPRTPYVATAIWAAYKLTQVADTSRPFEFWLQSDFYGIYGDVPALNLTDKLRENVRQTLKQIADQSGYSGELGTGEADLLLRKIPGFSALADLLPSQELLNSTLQTFEQEVRHVILPVARQMSTILMATLYAIPDQLRVIPMTVEVQLSTQIVSQHGMKERTGREPSWQGNITGVMKLKGAYRQWAQSLSLNKGDIK